MTHPQFEAIRTLIAQRNTNKAISRQLHVCPDTVARIRRELGLGNVPRQPDMLEEKWQRSTEPVTGGHLKWTGPVGRHGAPVLWFCRTDYRRPTAILAGLLPDTDECSRGHNLTTTEHARFYPDLRRYCGTCTKIRNSARTLAGASS